MALSYSTTLRNNRLDEITALVDAGVGAGKLKIQTSGGASTLSTHALSDPSSPAASAGVLTLSAIADDTSADATGTAAQYVLTDDADAVIVTGSVTGTGGGGDLELSSTSITAGDTVSVSSLTITEGNA